MFKKKRKNGDITTHPVHLGRESMQRYLWSVNSKHIILSFWTTKQEGNSGSHHIHLALEHCTF